MPLSHINANLASPDTITNIDKKEHRSKCFHFHACSRYAFVQHQSCACDVTLDGRMSRTGNCTRKCAGQPVSICGGAGFDMSVFDTGMTCIRV